MPFVPDFSMKRIANEREYQRVDWFCDSELRQQIRTTVKPKKA